MIKLILSDQRKIQAMTYALSMGLNDLDIIRKSAKGEEKKQIGIAMLAFKTAIIKLSELVIYYPYR